MLGLLRSLRLGRVPIYGALGWCVEIVWTAVESTATRRQRGWRLMGHTYLWMFPIYGLLAPLFEPLHDALRRRPPALRGAAYACGFLAGEYSSGWLLRRLVGVCPWDYTGRCRWHVHGLMRLDYAPLWAILGLALERVHDALDVLASTAIARAPSGRGACTQGR